MSEPTLVVLAAGMGSRYGGLKQIDPVGQNGEMIIDYSLYDAKRAGFEDVVFIIKHEIEDDFRAAIGDRISRVMNVSYAFQQLDMLPDGVAVPEGRVKPYGTTHALLCAEKAIDGRPFCVVNSDDYYGPQAYREIYGFLTGHAATEGQYAMVAYTLGKTLSDNGSVARGVCEEENGFLRSIIERVYIVKTPDGAEFRDERGEMQPLDVDSPVSLNYWGFTPDVFPLLREDFDRFLKNKFLSNPLKSESLLPNTVGTILKKGAGTVEMLRSQDRWFGVTYREDKPMFTESLRKLTEQGVYPAKLWQC